MTDLRATLQAALGDAYTLERELGGGGMSRVFVATETALGRQVVIKVVPIDGGAAAVDRFKREIQTAAQLQHPHIVPVLSAGIADGLPWFSMPYVTGDSLRARLAGRGALPVTDAMKILRDIAQALAFAHERGFIHRDIKPDNVLLSDGAAMVTDFGVAKALSSATGTTTADGMTALGVALGTPAYMAPEQASADPTLDHRADLYAWGCLAYELLSGVTPFGQRTPSQLFAAHLTEPPPPLETRRADCPAPLAALVMRCLEKEPARRPQGARELLAALDALRAPSGGEPTAMAPAPPAPRATNSPSAAARWGRAVAVGGVLLALGAGGFFLATRRAASDGKPVGAPAPDAASGTSLAVLPFVNTSGDAEDEYFSDGMTDELAHALSKLPGLKLAGRSTSFSYKGKSVPAPEIGRAIGVRQIIEGTVRRSGDRVRVTAQLTSTADGRVLWSDAFERSDRDVFAVQDAVTAAIVQALSPMLGSPTATAGGAESRGTTDAVAYDLYLRGRYFWAQRGAGPMDSALTYFRQAVARDPSFARGWAGLALTHVIRPNFNVLIAPRPAFDSADAAASRALELDSTLADAYSALAMAKARRLDARTAMQLFDRAQRLEPQNATAHHWAALIAGWAGQLDRTTSEIEQALALDPASGTTLNSAANITADKRQVAEALALWNRSASVSVLFGTNRWFNVAVLNLVVGGLADSVYRTQQRLLGTPAMQATLRTNRGFFGGRLVAAAAVGDWVVARALRDTITRNLRPGVVIFDQGLAATVFGTRQEAARLIMRSMLAEGAIGNLTMTPCFPALDFIREVPAYKAFLAEHQLASCPLPPVPFPPRRAPEAPPL